MCVTAIQQYFVANFLSCCVVHGVWRFVVRGVWRCAVRGVWYMVCRGVRYMGCRGVRYVVCGGVRYTWGVEDVRLDGLHNALL